MSGEYGEPWSSTYWPSTSLHMDRARVCVNALDGVPTERIVEQVEQWKAMEMLLREGQMAALTPEEIARLTAEWEPGEQS